MRIGFVLGAGGATGHGFHTGVLAALADVARIEAHDADLLVGTSAGSMVSALLRAGLHADDLYARALGEPPSARVREVLGRLGPPPASMPRPERVGPLRPASVNGLLAAGLRPWNARAGTVAAALVPEGTMPSEVISAPLQRVFGGRWPDRPTWICAVRLDDGKRVVFGREHRAADPADAVAASCAVPGWFSPVSIAGTRYVDGGAWSPTNADLVADERLDLVIVSSPMSSTPTASVRRVDAPARLLHHGYLRAEVARLRRRGTRVVTIEPTRADLDVMGLNAMDALRRATVARQVRASVAERLRGGDLRRQLG